MLSEAAGVFSCVLVSCGSPTALVTVLLDTRQPQFLHALFPTCVQCCTKQKLGEPC